jgi:hypothetical protein
VEDQRRVGRVPEEELLKDIDDNREGNQASEASGDLYANALLEEQLGCWMASGILKDAHLWELRTKFWFPRNR